MTMDELLKLTCDDLYTTQEEAFQWIRMMVEMSGAKEEGSWPS